MGFGLLRLGMPPSAEEMGRLVVFLVVTIAYAGVWLALAMLFSMVFRSTATAALVVARRLAVPVVAVAGAGALIARGDFAIRYPLRACSDCRRPTRWPGSKAWRDYRPARSTARRWWRCSIRDSRSLSTLLAQFQGRIAAPLPLDQSIMQAWPQIVSLIAGMILLYVMGYVVFQRQELRRSRFA